MESEVSITVFIQSRKWPEILLCNKGTGNDLSLSVGSSTVWYFRVFAAFVIAMGLALVPCHAHGSEVMVETDNRRMDKGYRPVCIHDPNDGWQSLRHGFRLMAHYNNEKVTEQLKAFPQYYFNRLSERILVHQFYLNKRIQEKGLPSELALLPLIESELNLKARSSARAMGLWQLMPRTARAYGLTVSKKCDERTDLEKATDAALTYIEYLYRRTNDWILTIAAYNAGLYRVKQSIDLARESGEYSDAGFWSLDLPAETRKHVAKFLALSHVVLLPGKHGIKLPSLSGVDGSGFSRVKSGYHSPECIIPGVGCLYCRQLVLMVLYIYFQSF